MTTPKREPCQQSTCEVCLVEFMRYDTKQVRCAVCQDAFRNTRKKVYSKTCNDCNVSFTARNNRALRCRDCIESNPNRPKGALNSTNVARRQGENIFLYVALIEFGSNVFYKVGLTSDPQRRLECFRWQHDMAEYLYLISGDIVDMFELEQMTIAALSPYRDGRKFSGWTECVQENPLDYIAEISSSPNVLGGL